ncbi:hypothetical protein [Actinacidiphila acididurans]|uniref:Integral membrane protein n=1 Tax=Actinacidiphila acididurans TaxID=2784346 RepID=A0ABS2TSD6_9ACTN|nr:hypothetical protein [Actinacidiphila acididurans]MBM9505175.1 hypothetical protein [Actinacidiphila acididurans]
MGVESDRLVFDYLSKVGDLAQTALPAAQRMRLVAQLRTDIDRERGDADSPAAVRRILGRIGTPDEVVEAAASGVPAAPPPVPAAPPAPSRPAPDADDPGTTGGSGERPKGYGPYAGRVPPPGRRPGAPRKNADDWWQAAPDGGDGMRAGDELIDLPGMTGRIFIPVDDEELAGIRPPGTGPQDAAAAGQKGPGAAGEQDPAAEKADKGAAAGGGDKAAPGKKRRLPRLPFAGGGLKGWGSPVLLLAAALLVAGAAIGSWIPLGLGWLTGWLTRKLTPAQKKFGILGIPGAAAIGMLVWLWGRDAGKWSTPIAQGQMGQAVQGALPGTVRLAALGSALYLVWRARRTA